MNSDIVFDNKNILTMKLLHYFITEKNYNPIILQGVENEIWLENLNEECEVIRIVSNYILFSFFLKDILYIIKIY